MKTTYTFLLLTAGVSLAACSESRQAGATSAAVPNTIHVGPLVHVSGEHADQPHGEVDLRAHPTDSNRLIGCSMLTRWRSRPDGGLTGSGTAVYTTADGGRTWTRALHVEKGIDPTCALGRDGSAYYVVTRHSGLVFYRSPDGGRRWLPPVRLPEPPVSNFSDRPFIVVDPREKPDGGTVYIAAVGLEPAATPEERPSTIKLWRSTDGGASFDPPAQYRVLPPRSAFVPTVPAVMADGAVLVGLIEWNREGWRCSDGGQRNARYLLLLSRDGGRSLSEPRPIAEICNEMNRTIASNVPSLAVDTTAGPFRDRIYAAWLDHRSGHFEVMVSWSADAGKTWSRPAVIDANRAVPYPEHDNFMPQLAVNKDGVVGLMWADRRDVADNLSYSIRFAASMDGGETWLPSVAVSQAPGTWSEGEFHALDPSAGVVYWVGFGDFAFTGGHTYGFTADAAGVFHPFWADHRAAGMPQVWTAAVQVDGKASRYGDPALAGYRDLESQVALELLEPVYDRGTLTLEARLKNLTTQPVGGPFFIQLTRLDSELGPVAVANADNELSGPGAIWRVDMTELVPEARSPGWTLAFRLSDLRPVRRDSTPTGLLQFSARILATPEGMSRQHSSGKGARGILRSNSGISDASERKIPTAIPGSSSTPCARRWSVEDPTHYRWREKRQEKGPREFSDDPTTPQQGNEGRGHP